MQITENQKNQIKKILLKDEIEAISVVNPQIYAENIKNFEKILQENRLKYAIHSVLKVNHSNALLRTALKNNLRADVSSLGELNQALEAGFTGERITANGPKNKKFLQKSVEIGATICVDSIEEIENLKSLNFTRDDKEWKIAVLIRLAGFDAEPRSRFGIRKNHWENIAKILSENENLDVLGIHFQIASVDILIRQKIFWEAVEFWKMLLKNGLKPKIINIGGSFGAYYQNDLTFHCKECANQVASKKMYPQSMVAGVDFLEKFLTENSHQGTSIRDFLRENAIELWAEPGRAILSNNTGFVATTVLGRREECIIVNTNSFSLGMREEELPTNPFLVEFSDEKPCQNHENSYWILGNLCLESDYIYARSIPFHREVAADDVIIFPDMAAYHMDFYETEAIAHPKKVKFFVDENKNLILDK